MCRLIAVKSSTTTFFLVDKDQQINHEVLEVLDNPLDLSVQKPIFDSKVLTLKNCKGLGHLDFSGTKRLEKIQIISSETAN